MRPALFALSMTLIAVFASPSVFAEEANGVMMVVKGDIKVTAGKDGKTENARVGRKVFSGDTIIAGPDSRAKIVMTDKNILNISPDSKMTIEKYLQAAAADGKGGQVELKVEYGKVRATVEQKYDGEKSKFNIKTPTAVAGVRGTDFITGFNRQTRVSSIITFSGTVAVGTAGPNGSIKNPVFVRPGQLTNVNEGKAPEAPKAMPHDELKNMNNESSADTAKAAPKQEAAPQQQQADQKKEEPKKDAAPAPAPDQGQSGNSGSQKDSSNASNGGNGSRAPASDASASGSSSGTASNKSPASAPAPTAPPPPPMPSSMITSSDLDVKRSNEINVNISTPKIIATPPPIVVATPVPTPPPALRSGKSRVSITIH